MKLSQKLANKGWKFTFHYKNGKKTVIFSPPHHASTNIRENPMLQIQTKVWSSKILWDLSLLKGNCLQIYLLKKKSRVVFAVSNFDGQCRQRIMDKYKDWEISHKYFGSGSLEWIFPPILGCPKKKAYIALIATPKSLIRSQNILLNLSQRFNGLNLESIIILAM